MAESGLILYGTGDLCPRDTGEVLALAAPTLKQGDIRFGQVEAIFSDRGPDKMGLRTSPRHVASLTSAGFDVVSLAGNHTLDYGEEACADSLEALRKAGIRTVGAGKNIDEARKPVIIEKKGTRIGFLAYCSVLPKGYAATADKPGCAPVRGVTTSYEEVDWQPGAPPRVRTTVLKEDLSAMIEDIKKVRPLVDLLVLSLHWGVHYTRGAIADYQKEVGYAAIDAGVDLILGHHAHILKPIEMYKGKVIFYSLGNFVMDVPIAMMLSHSSPKIYGWIPDPEYPRFPFPPDSRKSILAKVRIEGKKIKQASFLPVLINNSCQPRILKQGDVDFRSVVDYMTAITAEQGINVKYSVQGDEVLISV